MNDFEDYKPGDTLPEPAPAPRSADEPVQTVEGPHGAIYPDGYVETAAEWPDGFDPNEITPLVPPRRPDGVTEETDTAANEKGE